VVDENQLNLTDTLERMEGAYSALGLHISWTKTKIQTLGLVPVLQMLWWGVRRRREYKTSRTSGARYHRQPGHVQSSNEE